MWIGRGLGLAVCVLCILGSVAHDASAQLPYGRSGSGRSTLRRGGRTWQPNQHFLENYQIQRAVVSPGNFQIDITCELKALELACKTYHAAFGTEFDMDTLTRNFDPHYGYNPEWGYELHGMQYGAEDLNLSYLFSLSVSESDINKEIDSAAFQGGRELFFIRTVRLLAPAKSGRNYDAWLGSKMLPNVGIGIKKPGSTYGWMAQATKGLIRVLGRQLGKYQVRDMADNKDFTVSYEQLRGLTSAWQYKTEAILLGPPLKPRQPASPEGNAPVTPSTTPDPSTSKTDK
jgi:hypothetical protein